MISALFIYVASIIFHFLFVFYLCIAFFFNLEKFYIFIWLNYFSVFFFFYNFWFHTMIGKFFLLEGVNINF